MFIHFESTYDGALQFKARKFSRERLQMARKRILWHFKVGKESNTIIILDLNYHPIHRKSVLTLMVKTLHLCFSI